MAALFFVSSSAVFPDGEGVDFTDARERALGWLRGQMVPNGTVEEPEAGRLHLVLSYALPPSDPARPWLAARSMTYDNALAVIAFTIAGDYRNAAFLLNTLSRLVRPDGGLWFGYNTHNSWPSPEDFSGAIDRTGATAWAGYAALFYLLERVKTEPDFLLRDREAPRYLAMAEALARRLVSLQIQDVEDPRYGLLTGGLNSYTLAVEGGEVVEHFTEGTLDWASTEHNIDAWFFLRDLSLLSGEPEWGRSAELIEKALVKLWSDKDGQFYQGRKADRIDTVLALDCASWGALFCQASGRKPWARTCLKTVEKRYSSGDSVPGRADLRVSGYKPYAQRVLLEGEGVSAHYFADHPDWTWKEMQGVWGEGSLGVALAYIREGNSAKAEAIIAEVLKLQGDDGGVRYFSRAIPHEFVDYPSVASTAWLSIVLSQKSGGPPSGVFMGKRD